MSTTVNDSQTQLLFLLADLLGSNVYQMTAKNFRASFTREFAIGPVWKTTSDVTMAVDELSPKLLTAFIRIRANLWAYAVITTEGQWLLMFDNDRAKIRPGAEHEFGSGSGMAAMRKLKPAITGALSFIRPQKQWVACDPQELVSDV